MPEHATGSACVLYIGDSLIQDCVYCACGESIAGDESDVTT